MVKIVDSSNTLHYFINFEKYVYLCNYNPNKDVEHFSHSGKFLCIHFLVNSPHIPVLANHIFDFCIEMTNMYAFVSGFLSLSNVLESVYVIMWAVVHTLLFLSVFPSRNISWFFYSFSHWRSFAMFPVFLLLWIKLQRTLLWKSLWPNILISVGYVLMGRIAVSVILWNSCYLLYSYQHCMKEFQVLYTLTNN